MIERYSCP